MMYGFGDVREPYEETLATLEDAVQDYVVNTVKAGGLVDCRRPFDPPLPRTHLQMKMALAVAGKRGGGNVKFEHLIHLVRHDSKKKQRVKVAEGILRRRFLHGLCPPIAKELLLTSEEIQEAKRPYKEADTK